MNKNFYAFCFILLSFTTLASAQSLNIFYQIKDGTANRDTVIYYIQNTSSSVMPIRAANFSVAFQTSSGYTYNPGPNNCVGRDTLMYMTYSWFNTIWTPPFTEACAIQNQTLTHNSQSYNKRFSYGISDFSFIGPPNPLNLAASMAAPVLAMKIAFDRTLITRVYPEDEAENISNQFGDISFTAIPYSMQVMGSGFPVDWAGFDGEVRGNKTAHLSWQTASELNTDYFEVERSIDGSFDNPTIVGQVTAQGYSDSYVTYQFIDENMAASHSYYRIKNVDMDGQSSYSSIIQLVANDQSYQLVAYPNPTSGTLSVKMSTLQDEAFKLTLFNLQGQLIWEGNNSFGPASQDHLQLDLSAYPAGIYILEAAPLSGNLHAQHIRISKH